MAGMLEAQVQMLQTFGIWYLKPGKRRRLRGRRRLTEGALEPAPIRSKYSSVRTLSAKAASALLRRHS